MQNFNYVEVEKIVDKAFDAAMAAEKTALRKIKPASKGYVELGFARAVLQIDDRSPLASHLLALDTSSMGVSVSRNAGGGAISISFLLVNGGQLLVVSEAAMGAALIVLKEELRVEGFVDNRVC